MKKIRLGHVGSLHDHSSAKLACVLKFPEIFEVVGWVPENKEREMLLRNSFPYCRVPVMTRERLLEAEAVFDFFRCAGAASSAAGVWRSRLYRWAFSGFIPGILSF